MFRKLILFSAVALGTAYAATLHAQRPEWKDYTSVFCQDDSSTVPLKYSAIEKVSYCANPVDRQRQILNIYVPTAYLHGGKVGKYTADTAPIIYYNTSGGYASSKAITPGDKRQPEGHYYEFLQKGYVLVGIGTRGKETTDVKGVSNGQAPAIIVDLKAGIRYLKANDSWIPGDANKIVSLGFSSGGGLSALIGATGNSKLYEPYLQAIGAVDATDNIFIAVCYCPMANLNIADASFEWYHQGTSNYGLFSFLGGGKHTFTPFEKALSRALSKELVSDLQQRGLDIGSDGRSGSFYRSFVALYENGISDYVKRFCKTSEKKAEYLQKLDPQKRWLTWDDKKGKATIDYLVFDSLYLRRMKACPSFDAYNYRSNEGTVFGNNIQPKRHYSRMVVKAIKAVSSDYPKEAAAYLAQYEPDLSAETDKEVYLMSAINFIGTNEQVDLAPYWRFRVGSEDADQGLPAAHILAQALDKVGGIKTDEGIIWGLHHTAAEYTIDDLSDYIDSCCAAR